MSDRGAAGVDRRAVLTMAGGLLAATAPQALAAPLKTAQVQPAPMPATPPPPRPVPPTPKRPPAHIPLSAHQSDVLAKALADAEGHGFRRDEFVKPELAQALHGGDMTSPQAQDLLKAAVLDYARAQRGLRIPASQFLEEWSVRPAAYDPEPEFAAAVSADRLGPWLDSLPPRYEGYLALRTALGHYRTLAAKGWKPAPTGPSLKEGMKDPRVAAIRARLAAEDPTTPAAPHPAKGAKPGPETYDAALARAVKAYQQRNGLAPDGIAGPPTIAAMNAPPGQRVLQIEANMERWRWLPRELPATRIQVNIAAAVLAVYRDGEPVMAMKAVAGRPKDQTPMLSSNISSIVLNPPWHVPDSIAKKELFPKAARDHGYLARNQYEVVKTNGFTRLVQKAGPKSALGRFKFDFVNSFGVYLHDTPAQAGFSRTSRLSSHGCVRLEQPKLLADLLLQGDTAWSPDRVAQQVTTDKTVRVSLAESIPVYILYWTAFVDGSGAAQFRPDAYDWDHDLIRLLDSSRGHDSSSVNLSA